jgi:hypothetical protein
LEVGGLLTHFIWLILLAVDCVVGMVFQPSSLVRVDSSVDSVFDVETAIDDEWDCVLQLLAPVDNSNEVEKGGRISVV